MSRQTSVLSYSQIQTQAIIHILLAHYPDTLTQPLPCCYHCGWARRLSSASLPSIRRAPSPSLLPLAKPAPLSSSSMPSPPLAALAGQQQWMQLEEVCRGRRDTCALTASLRWQLALARPRVGVVGGDVRLISCLVLHATPFGLWFPTWVAFPFVANRRALPSSRSFTSG